MSLEESQMRKKTAGRNDPCPCGSGKKYKRCHATEDEQVVHEELTRQRIAAEAAAAAAAEAEAEAEEGNKKPGAGGTPGKKPKVPTATSKQAGSRAGEVAARAASLPRRGAV